MRVYVGTRNILAISTLTVNANTKSAVINALKVHLDIISLTALLKLLPMHVQVQSEARSIKEQPTVVLQIIVTLELKLAMILSSHQFLSPVY